MNPLRLRRRTTIGTMAAQVDTLENTSHDDRLLVLRHVCLEAHKIHFFGNDSAAAAFQQTAGVVPRVAEQCNTEAAAAYLAVFCC